MYINTIKVTTFKESGKYYDEWTLELRTEHDTWYDIIEVVRKHKENTSKNHMEWLIGMDDSRDDMYPIIIK